MQERKYKTCYLFYTSFFGSKTYLQIMFLPNFSDVYKSPSVSKSSTFNKTADTFSSLDDNFLKLNSSEQIFVSKSSNLKICQ